MMRVNISNYSVEIDLQSAEFSLHQDQINLLESRLQKIGSANPWFNDICSLKSGVLRYESISLFPTPTDPGKEKVLLVLGNPSIISVKNGMFFYSRRDGGRHGFWGKLVRAGLVKPVTEDTRYREAENRRNRLINDDSSPLYSIGITSFYSFPTPGSDDQPFCGSGGVEKLLEPILKQVRRTEIRRLLSHPFLDGSILIFTRKSLLKTFYKHTGIKPSYWPIRGEDSGGEELAEVVSSAAVARITGKPLLI